METESAITATAEITARNAAGCQLYCTNFDWQEYERQVHLDQRREENNSSTKVHPDGGRRPPTQILSKQI
jgi:hypothetical protein